MNKKNQLTTLIAVGILGAPIVAQAQGSYTYETVDHPGVMASQLLGINNKGTAAGTGIGFPSDLPFVYDTKKGTLTDVAPVAGYLNTTVAGISDKGVLVGSVFDGSMDSGLIIDKNGATTVFNHPDAMYVTNARGVNSKGLVAGMRDSAADPGGLDNGFIYDPQTDTFTDIVPSLFTIAHGINSRGDVVGHAVFSDIDTPCLGFPAFTRMGWRRAADGTVTYFNVNGVRTSARGITESGTIAGFSTDPGTGAEKGFVVELDGSQCQTINIPAADLLEVPGAIGTFIGGIKNSGEIVGSYLDAGGYFHGFVAKPEKSGKKKKKGGKKKK